MDWIAIQTLLIGIVVAISCSILGVFLVLRKMSMMIDAISHTILFGIVIAYMISGDLSSPFILLGATLVGLLTVILIEVLVKTRRTSEDAATGIVFPLLFSLAVIIISIFYKNTHLDSHAITGNLELAAFEQIEIFGIMIGAKSLYISFAVLAVVIVFVVLFFKELKILTFDRALAYTLGVAPAIIHYILMSLISLTAVSSFNSVGVILVVAMMIGPAVSSILLTKDLKKTIIVAILIGAFNAATGYFIAMYPFNGNVNLASTMAVVTLISFLLIWLFEPRRGLIRMIFKKQIQKNEFEFVAFIFHVKEHEYTKKEQKELDYQLIKDELNWTKEKLDKHLHKAIDKGYVEINDKIIHLTHVGHDYYRFIASDFEQLD